MEKPAYGLLLGPTHSSRGGMTAVLTAHREAGLFERYPIRHLCTYEGPGLSTQARVMLIALASLLGMLLSRRVAFLHAHMAARGSFWRKSLLCSIGFFFGVPYALHIHGGTLEEFYYRECNALSRWWIRQTFRRAKRLVCLSDAWQFRLKRIEPSANCLVIGNPVTVPKQLPRLRQSPRTILFLGRIKATKGVFDLIEAIPKVLATHGSLRFVLAGDQDIEGARRRARELGVEAAVELPGWVEGSKKALLLSQADVFVLPSHFECLPVSILEAMAAGIPVIGSTTDGIADLVDHEVHGLLVPPGDVDGLAASLVRLISDFELREQLREAAYARVAARYAMPAIMAKMDALYEELLGWLRSDRGQMIQTGQRSV